MRVLNSKVQSLRAPVARRLAVQVEAMAGQQHQQPSEDAFALNRRSVLGASAAAAAAPIILNGMTAGPAVANTVVSSEWEQIDLPIDKQVVLLDIGFIDENRGFLLGTRQTLLETQDGGRTWEKREVPNLDEGINYRFTSISFDGDEGWIVGKPAILFRTQDAGKSWKRVPLSAKLPGDPVKITSLGKDKAEMVTNQGAVYVTDNGAYSWTAGVQETVDATLNRTVSSGISGASYYEGYFSQVNRADNGKYVAVSSRGNFFMTWEPGQTYWQPHNRPAARRVQSMGWDRDNHLWLTTRGGDLLLSEEAGVSEKFAPAKLGARGFGVLDVGFRTNTEAYACGGSGSLFKSVDGGKTWKRDKAADNIAGNLYAIKFFGPSTGFVLGNDSIILRYIAQA